FVQTPAFAFERGNLLFRDGKRRFPLLERAQGHAHRIELLADGALDAVELLDLLLGLAQQVADGLVFLSELSRDREIKLAVDYGVALVLRSWSRQLPAKDVQKLAHRTPEAKQPIPVAGCRFILKGVLPECCCLPVAYNAAETPTWLHSCSSWPL